MKIFNFNRGVASWLRLILVCLTTGCVFTSCNDDDSEIVVSEPFDPSKPIVINSFTPESGGAYEQIIIKGSNFGDSKENVSLTIGGKDAVVINVVSDKIYAFVPPQAFSGEINLTVFDASGNAHTAVGPKAFIYESLPVVGTLCGYQNDNDTQGELWGSFDICAGFNAEGTLAIDPLNHDKVYVVYDKSAGMIAQLDLAARECTPLMNANKFQTARLRNVDFSLDGKYMLVSTDRDDQGFNSTSVWIVTRNTDDSFSNNSSAQPLVAYKQCNGVAVHPMQ